jgi:hypothetical protein
MTKPETKPHPHIRPDELTASQVAARVGCERQTVLKRHERYPDKLPGRLLPFVPGLTASGRGIWAFKASGVDTWLADKRAARKKARLIARLAKAGVHVYRRGKK